MELAEQLNALKQSGWRALVAGNGGAYSRKHPSANAVMAFPSGTLSREDALEAMPAARPWSASRSGFPR